MTISQSISQANRATSRASRDEILTPLEPQFRSTLISMYNHEPQPGSDGQTHNLDQITRISREQGMWLYSLCRDVKPKMTLEIGLAYGFSLIYFLAAIRENGIGYHTAVDPFQADYHGIGLCKPQAFGMSDSFRWIEERSVPALVHSGDRGETFEVIFIDGNHRFDDVIVDFTLSAELCPVGGTIILDDMWMPSVRKAVGFIRSNRKDFSEIRTPVPNITAFRRLKGDTRKWNHYTQFFDTYYLRRAMDLLTPSFIRNSRTIHRLRATGHHRFAAKCQRSGSRCP
jgi:predicted O-methyltransferase YrrM